MTDLPKISFETFKKRVAFTLQNTENEVARKKIKDILFLAEQVDLKQEAKQ